MLKQRAFRLFCGRCKNKFLAATLMGCLVLNLFPVQVLAQLIDKTGANTTDIVSLLVQDEIYNNKTLKPCKEWY